MSNDEIVIKHPPRGTLPGWPCPRCQGVGHMGDGWGSWSPTETRIRPPSTCYVCTGSGRVNVTPIAKETIA